MDAGTVALPNFPALCVEFGSFLLRVGFPLGLGGRRGYRRLQIAFKPGIKAGVVLELELRAFRRQTVGHCKDYPADIIK